MQPNGYFHATYSAGSVSERDTSVDESLSMQPNGYFHASYSAGSVSERDTSVDESITMCQTATSMPGSVSDRDLLVDVSPGLQTWQPLQLLPCHLFCWKCQ